MSCLPMFGSIPSSLVLLCLGCFQLFFVLTDYYKTLFNVLHSFLYVLESLAVLFFCSISFSVFISLVWVLYLFFAYSKLSWLLLSNI